MTIFSLRATQKATLKHPYLRVPHLICGILFIILTPFAIATETSPFRLTLSINGDSVTAEVAATPSTRRLGLSHRPHLPPTAGMLLAFPAPKRICLWMRDVSFPLSAIFIDATAAIVSVAQMQPHTETRHCAPTPALYALEVSPDWLAKNNIKAGDKVIGLPATDYFFDL